MCELQTLFKKVGEEVDGVCGSPSVDGMLVALNFAAKNLTRCCVRLTSLTSKAPPDFEKQHVDTFTSLQRVRSELINKLLCAKGLGAWQLLKDAPLQFITSLIGTTKPDLAKHSLAQDVIGGRFVKQAVALPSETGFGRLMTKERLMRRTAALPSLRPWLATSTAATQGSRRCTRRR